MKHQSSGPRSDFFGSQERMPPSPCRARLDGNARQPKLAEVPQLPGFIDDKDETSNKASLSDLHSVGVQEIYDDPQVPARALGRPPKMCHDRPLKIAPKARLCSELARDGIFPVGMVALLSCVAAAAYSNEDHSLSGIHRAIATASEDIRECWLSTLVVMAVALIAVIGLVCTYICMKDSPPAASSKACPSNIHTSYSRTREDSLRRRRTGGTGGLF